MRSFKIITGVLFTLALSGGSVLAAEKQKATIRVDGLACPFCAYGLEKKLLRLDGVEDWDIKINDGLVILYFNEDARVDEDLLKRKVKEAGFTPRETTLEKVVVVAGEHGRAKRDKTQTFLLRVSGMACSECGQRVAEALSALDCVERVEVSPASGETNVECTDATADASRFVEAVEKIGFEAEMRR